jgi:hypothetical protein
MIIVSGISWKGTGDTTSKFMHLFTDASRDQKKSDGQHSDERPKWYCWRNMPRRYVPLLRTIKLQLILSYGWPGSQFMNSARGNCKQGGRWYVSSVNGAHDVFEEVQFQLDTLEKIAFYFCMRFKHWLPLIYEYLVSMVDVCLVGCIHANGMRSALFVLVC